MFEQTTKEEKSVKFPFFGGLAYPVMEIRKKNKDFLLLTGLVALVCSFIEVIIGRSYFCGVIAEGVCSNNLFSVIISTLVMFAGLGFYISRWVNIAFEDTSFKEAIKQKCFKQDIKAIFLVFLYSFLWAAVCFGVYFLSERTPVDNWKIELAVFVAVSAIVIVALILLMNFVIFFRFLQKKSVFVLKQTFWPIFDNIFKLLAWFLIYFLIFFSLLRGGFFYFLSSTYLPTWLRIIGNEFFIDFVIFTIAAVYVLQLKYMTNYLAAEKK